MAKLKYYVSGDPEDPNSWAEISGGGVTDHSLLTGRSDSGQHPIGAITGLQDALDGKAGITDIPDVSGLVATSDPRLTDNRTPTAHVHSAADITSGLISTARLGTGFADATTVLHGDGTWAASSGNSSFFPVLYRVKSSDIPPSNIFWSSVGNVYVMADGLPWVYRSVPGDSSPVQIDMSEVPDPCLVISLRASDSWSQLYNYDYYNEVFAIVYSGTGGGNFLIGDVPSSRMVAGKTLSSDVSISPADIGAAPAVRPVGTGLATSGTVNLDMAAVHGTIQTIALSGDVTFTTSNRAAGREITLVLSAGGSSRTLTWPSWLVVGAALPTSLASGKTAVITATCTDTTDAATIAAGTVQA